MYYQIEPMKKNNYFLQDTTLLSSISYILIGSYIIFSSITFVQIIYHHSWRARAGRLCVALNHSNGSPAPVISLPILHVLPFFSKKEHLMKCGSKNGYINYVLQHNNIAINSEA